MINPRRHQKVALMINLHSDNKEEDNDDLDDLDVLGFQLQGTLLLLLVRGARKVPLENNLEMFKIFVTLTVTDNHHAR